ncbi:beta-hydroxyacyl-ACP dehydratase [Mucilaginibacter paludis]|uniref:Beta-hydroxyacyl-(Acyl-carrier-protein) dehydratase FabA/FabZ n=1 Tax=Mucilaginibacter paludis DSM 18603 TaxID=714943 RepID=H1Y1H9_9SPHI|nr:beta-hydroxyacyl-ACP dehydratase [Mucilaginibacter paludis]EHQ30853.1 Beta-hydroxyacyl-(acyl-carrier-protein) dehydratase FabA/FabZ [Mucilaginibacter paludis DSM 18603]
MLQKDIHTLIPQKMPFVMVDSLLSVSQDGAQTNFRVTEENVLVENGHFTEAGLMENIAQTAAARAGYTALAENRPVEVGYIGAVKNLEIFNLPMIGDELITEIKIENQIFDVTVISGKVMCKDKVMAMCEMKIFINK